MGRKKTDPYDFALKEMQKASPDVSVAVKMLRRAVARKDPRAAYALGTWYLHGKYFDKNLREAIRLLQIAIDANIPEALFDMAVSYENGNGVRKNARSAAEHYLRSALYGDHQAVYEVGRCYYYAIGFQQDRKVARIWFDRARTLNVYESQSEN